MKTIPDPRVQYGAPLPQSGRRLMTVSLADLPAFLERNDYDPFAYIYVQRFYDDVLFVRKIPPETQEPPASP